MASLHDSCTSENACCRDCSSLSYRFVNLVGTALTLWGSLISTHIANIICFLLWRYLMRTGGDPVDVPKRRYWQTMVEDLWNKVMPSSLEDWKDSHVDLEAVLELELLSVTFSFTLVVPFWLLYICNINFEEWFVQICNLTKLIVPFWLLFFLLQYV